MENGITRRSLLATATLVTGTALVGNATMAKADEDSSDWMPSSWDRECDFLIIGYGGAGLWASLIAADECGADVLCLEKAPVRGGGNSSINMGDFTYIDDIEGGVKYILAFTQGLVDEDYARAWATECNRNLEYVEKYGGSPILSGFGDETEHACEYPDMDTEYAMHVYSQVDNGTFGVGGAAFEIYDAKREELGVEVVFSCHDEELIQNPQTKEIVGCYTHIGDDESKVAIKAKKAVLLSTGGFEMNTTMHAQYLRCYPARGFYGWPFNEGDGHKMALAVGAQLRNMRDLVGAWTTNFPNNEYLYAISASPTSNSYIYVDRFGARWCNETDASDQHNSWRRFTEWDNAIGDYARIPSWVVFDASGFEGRLGPAAGATTMNMWMEGLPEEVGAYQGWSEDNSVELEKGWIKTGETLEDLVADMAADDSYVDDKMDVDTLRASIERWNELCEAGEDTDFGRNAASMSSISLDGPFYAMPIYPGGCTTLGGPAHNQNGQVLDTRGEVIPRLYCAGSISNFQEHTYGITGGGNGENMVMGRICARHACSLDAWDEE